MNAHDLATALVRATNQRDLEAARALFGPGAELCFPRFSPKPVYRGPRQLAEFFVWLMRELPVQTLAADRIVATGERAFVEFEIAGRSAAGHTFDSVGAMVVDCADGLVESVRLYIDTHDLGRVLEASAAA